MAVTDYAATTDLAAYLPNVVPAEENANWTTFLHAASRAIDGWCDRYFYADGSALKYFNVDNDKSTRFVLPDWAGDFYSPTLVKIALYENADPAGTDWTTISGDGVTPPSNYFCGPENPARLGNSASPTLTRPFHWISLPQKPNPADSTNYMRTFTQGMRTLAITASWGWPAVPDDIKDVCVKLVIRMWKAKDSGFNAVAGSPDFGTPIPVARYLDMNDIGVLNRYKRPSV